MTSSAEGWGLTLTESLQRGVVPVAMDSSPVFHEIIQDGVDGFITPDKDSKAYTSKISGLMADEALWRRMAQHALQHASRFSMGNTIDKWEELLR
jgi:glycosyltransferase involved in cell wall biosynthesis